MNIRKSKRTALIILAAFIFIPLVATTFTGCSDSGVGIDEDEILTGETDWKGYETWLRVETNERASISGEEGNRQHIALRGQNKGTAVDMNPSTSETDYVDFTEALTAFRVILKVRPDIFKPDQRPEGIAIQVRNGNVARNLTNFTMSEIVGEDKVITEETEFVIPINPKEAFAAGTWYRLVAFHGTEVRGEDYTDGEDEYLFKSAAQSQIPKIRLEWKYDRAKYAAIERQHQ